MSPKTLTCLNCLTALQNPVAEEPVITATDPESDGIFDNRASRITVGLLAIAIAMGMVMSSPTGRYAWIPLLVFLLLIVFGTALLATVPPPRKESPIPVLEMPPDGDSNDAPPAAHRLNYARRGARKTERSPFYPLLMAIQIIGGFLWVPLVAIGIEMLQAGQALGVTLLLLVTVGVAIALLFTRLRGISIGIFLAIMLLLLVIVICH